MFEPDNNPFSKFAPPTARPLSDAQWSAVSSFFTRASFGQAEFKQEKTEKGQLTFNNFLVGYIYRIEDDHFYWYLFEEAFPERNWTGGGGLEEVSRSMLQKMFHLHVERRAEKHAQFSPRFMF